MEVYEQERLIQAASHIASGMAAAQYRKSPKGPPLSDETIADFVRLSVEIAPEIVEQVHRAK